MSDTPHVDLCATAQHLDTCGECADVLQAIVKAEVEALIRVDAVKAPDDRVAVPAAAAVEPEQFDKDGVPLPKLSGLMTSHADYPNATDHPVEYAAKCGICIAMKRKGEQRREPQNPNTIIAALDRL